MIWKMQLQLQLVKVFICSAVGSMGLTRFFDQLLVVMMSLAFVTNLSC